MPRTATERSRARNKRAARILGGITLDQEHDEALKMILAATGENTTEWIRRMIRERAAAARRCKK